MGYMSQSKFIRLQYGGLFLRRRICRNPGWLVPPRTFSIIKTIHQYRNPWSRWTLNQFQVGIIIIALLLHSFNSFRILWQSWIRASSISVKTPLTSIPSLGCQLDSMKMLLCHFNLGRRTACALSTLLHLLLSTSGLMVMTWVSLKLTV